MQAIETVVGGGANFGPEDDPSYGNRTGTANKDSPGLGHGSSPGFLCGHARERALGVLADPVYLVQIGTAAAMLAYVNIHCGDQETCTVRYADAAATLGVSVSTIKAWADALDKLGYFTRTPSGRSGVLIHLNAERWPGPDRKQDLAIERVTGIVTAARVTINAALDGAVAQLQPAERAS